MSDTESEQECKIEVKLEGQRFTLLTEIVRNQYLKFLKKQLENNLLSCCRDVDFSSENDRLERLVRKCSQNLEDLAIKEATLTQLYQRAMVKTIDTVRCCTKECRLLEEMQILLTLTESKTSNSQTSTKATQTEDYEEQAQMLSLDERIDSFQKHLNQKQKSENKTLTTENYNSKYGREQRKRRTNSSQNYNDEKRLNCTRVSNSVKKTSPVGHSPTPPPQTPPKNPLSNCTLYFNKQPNEAYEEQLAGDEVAEELEKLFMEQETDLEEIFGISLKNNISNCDTKESPTNENFVVNQNQAAQSAVACVDTEENFTKNNGTICTKSMSLNQSNQIYRQPVHDLRHSLWPCECFMQKRRLSATLTRLVEEDIRWTDILKMQFTLLFGDDNTQDDFATCSPSLEMDEVITSSCMRRISPWVVRHLMKPLQDGLIGNRFLFKKLAKKLAYHIITENHYPNELLIKTAVENFFCLHCAVMTVDDLNDIDTMTIVDSG